MTKQDLVERISEQTGLDPLTTRHIVESFFETVRLSLVDGQPVYIRRFGSFTLKRRAAKIGRHLAQKRSMPIAAHVIPYFKASPEWVEAVKARLSLKPWVVLPNRTKSVTCRF